MEEGWIEYEDACYVYVDKLYTFEQARSYCHGYIGGTADLVFNMNSNANSFTYNLVGNKTTFKIAGKLWIGLRVFDSANQSHWIKNDFRSYRNWIYGQHLKRLYWKTTSAVPRSTPSLPWRPSESVAFRRSQGKKLYN